MNFVDREQELAELESRYDEMLRGKGNILFISGEMGMGKTTLVHHWYRSVSLSSHPPMFVKAVCTIPMGGNEIGTLESLEPWADILTQLVTLGPLQHAKEKIDISRLIHDTAPSWTWAIPDTRTADQLSNDLTGADRRLRYDDDIRGDQAAESQPHIFQQYTNILNAISQNHSLVLFIDDMHWADASSCNLLTYLSRRIANARILIILTSCDSIGSEIHEGKKDVLSPVKDAIVNERTGAELALPSLNQPAIRRLLVSSFPNYRFDERFEAWLQLVSNGNALFIAEYSKTLREDGLLDENGKFIGNYDTLIAPNSPYAVVMERIHRLDEATRTLLSYATAEGELFTEYALIQAINKKPKEILSLLKKAESQGIIWFIGTRQLNENHATTIFSFTHALFHQALYNAMNDEDRAAVHRSYLKIFKGEWNNELNEQRRALIAPKLLIHAERCGDLVFIARTALAAAQMFWTEFSETESLQMIAQAAKYADIVQATQPDSYDDAFKRQVVYEYQLLNGTIDLVRGRFDDAKRWYFNAEKIATQLHDDHAIIDAINGYANMFKRRGDYKELARITEPTLTKAEEIKYIKGNIECLHLFGIAYSEMGEHRSALASFQRALEISEHEKLPIAKMRSLASIGNVYRELLDFAKAKHYYQRVLELSQVYSAPLLQNSVLQNYGIICSFLGDYDLAEKLYAESMSISKRIGDRVHEAVALRGIGEIKRLKYDTEGALQSFSECLAIAREMGMRKLEMVIMYSTGIVLFDMNLLHKSLEWQKQSYQIADELDDKQGLSLSSAQIGIILKHLNNIPEAEKFCTNALNVLRVFNSSHPALPTILYEAIDIYIDMNKLELAQECLEEVQTICEQMKNVIGRGQVFIRWGKFYRRKAEFVTSRSYLDKALSIAVENNQKDLQADVNGELGLLNEAEGKRAEAIQLLHKSVAYYQNLSPRCYEEWKAELDRVERAA